MGRNTDRALAVDVEPLMAASRTINAMIVRSLAAVDETLTVPELRVLVILSGHDGASLTDVANDLGVNPSNASRTCEKLVQRKLIKRQSDVDDRRRLVLGLSGEGKRLLGRVMDRRRRLLETVVVEMSAKDQKLLMSVLGSFNEAATAAGPADHRPTPSRLAPWLEQ